MTAITSQTRAILFDHDGTLIDSERTHFELWQAIAREQGVTIDHDFYCRVMAGIPVKQNAQDLVSHFSLSVGADVLAEKKYAAMRDFLATQAFPLMPGAKAVIQASVEAGYTLAIVTGGSGLSVRRTIEKHGLDGLFSTVVAAEDVVRSKPAPDCYNLALKQLKFSSEQAIAVEDTVHGMQAALAAKLRCVAIPGDYSDGQDFSAATVTYASLQDWCAAELND
ncbi:HAD family hydrolase [Alteromonas halophila]|uniref:Hydrolase n=1 Tax=Alteromonas halophila TaxID=516698 RepID=A0A918MW58_9ALTE|nr:HAD family phosphatase [Alteromonas halophila]GGW80209.1 hydrolase [Alteromonas halophila]